MSKTRYRRPLVTPAATEACWCGSAETYADCCAGNLPEIMETRKAAAAARSRGDKGAALSALRADLSLWIILHRTTTQPAMRAGIVGLGELVEADIENLTDAAIPVAELMHLTGEATRVSAMIEGLRGVVDDPRWDRRLVYIQAYHLWKAAGPSDARKELSKLGAIGPEESDRRILRMAISVFSDGRPFSQALALYDRLFDLAIDLEDRMRALGLKAAVYIEHGDEIEAGEELARAIALVAEDEQEDLSWDEARIFSWCLRHLAITRRDSRTFDRAERLIQFELRRPGLTALGEAVWFEELGELLRFANMPAKALEAYEAALRRRGSNTAAIFAAECMLRIGRGADARRALQGLDVTRLDANEYEDYLFATTATAIQSADRSAQQRASQRLRAHRGTSPYFEQRRLNFLVAVEDAMKNGPSARLLARVQTLLSDPVRKFNRWVMFEPNIAGIGVRANNILEDMAGGKATER